MKRIFISYAREDKARVDDLARRLRQLEYQPWMDNELHGGQKWWDVILGNIAESDLFLCIISHSYLDSDACALERNYAQAAGRPIVPVKIANVTESAMPSELAGLHIVSYTTPGEEAAFALVDAIRRAPDAPPLPSPMPPTPRAPMSYLTGAADAVAKEQLTKSEQRDVLDEIERGLRSENPDDRQGAREILGRMQARGDLYADVVARMDELERRGKGPRRGGRLIAAGVVLVAIVSAGVVWNASRQESPTPLPSPAQGGLGAAVDPTFSRVSGLASGGAVRTSPPIPTARDSGLDTHPTASGQTGPDSCADGGSCVIGDTGPGGGAVFYVADKPHRWGQYLEAAPPGWSGSGSDPVAAWCADGPVTVGSTRTGIGTGSTNTRTMRQVCGSGAAVMVSEYRGGGESDWFLPSREELAVMWSSGVLSRTHTGDAFSNAYWSSSESGDQWAWCQQCNDGHLDDDYFKDATFYVRPVRAFLGGANK